jgi:predicted AAA+ superfamily ATPase
MFEFYEFVFQQTGKKTDPTIIKSLKKSLLNQIDLFFLLFAVYNKLNTIFVHPHVPEKDMYTWLFYDELKGSEKVIYQDFINHFGEYIHNKTFSSSEIAIMKSILPADILLRYLFIDFDMSLITDTVIAKVFDKKILDTFITSFRKNDDQLEDFLLYGSYPDTLNAVTPQDKITYLTELVDSYLLKDILALDNIKSPKALRDLLKLLALQIGNEVSLNELGQKLGWDLKTVERYLDLLEQCFVIVRLGGFSRNLRTEITRKSKYYFLDTGVRNALLQQFNALDSRNDRGALLENFLVVERLKYRSYTKLHGSSYFWRTHSQQEVDLVEDRDGELHGYEFKWSSKKHVARPTQWSETYPSASFDVVNRDNYLDFVA